MIIEVINAFGKNLIVKRFDGLIKGEMDICTSIINDDMSFYLTYQTLYIEIDNILNKVKYLKRKGYKQLL